MKGVLVKLHFCAPVHFGSGRLSDSESTCAADTLFSALFIEALAQKTEESLLEAVRAGELLISDAFPWTGTTYYLPKPYIPSELATMQDKHENMSSVKKKAFKKLHYIPEESIASFFNGTLDATKTRERLQNDMGTEQVVTKVNLSRDQRDEAEPYNVGGFRFNENAGLYFFVRGSYDLKPLIETLQYSGLGGKRSTGYGRFEFEIIERGMVKDHAIPRPFSMLLSSAMPIESELDDELLKEAAYSLKKRSGFIQSSDYAPVFTKKRDFYTFTAGSVFAKKFDGDVFDVGKTGAHPVWRYAKAFWME